MEQEKREQVKQSMLPGNNLNAALPPLSDLEFERLKADVLSESSQNLLPTQGKHKSFLHSSFVTKRNKRHWYNGLLNAPQMCTNGLEKKTSMKCQFGLF